VRRGWVVAFAGACLLNGACAAIGNLGQSSPSAQTSPSSEASPSPSPSPSPSSIAPLAISSFGLHSGEVGLAFAAINLGATGGAPPYTWTQAGGSLPPGLSLSQDGVISGSTTTPGIFTFGVRVDDSGGGAVLKSGSIRVYGALTVTQPCVGQCIRGKGCTTCGVFGTATGGAGPYTYKVVGGAIPPGMNMSQLSLVGGFPAGGYSLTVLVTDKLGATETVGANWSIYKPAILSRTRTGDCQNFGNPPQCTTTGWTYSGGSPSVKPQVVIVRYSQYCGFSCYPVPTAPPPGWKVTIGSGVITFQAGGIPCNAIPSSYGGKLTIQLRDPAKCATTLASNQQDLIVEIGNNC
jgi:hypothetical protein